MEAFQMNIAVMRGEAMAANLLASVALQFLLMQVAEQSRENVLSGMAAFIDDTLNRAGPGAGDANDEFNAQVRETARFQAMQCLDHLRLNFIKR